MSSRQWLATVVIGALVIGGCSKKEEEKAPVIPSAGPTATPAPSAAPEAPTTAAEQPTPTAAPAASHLKPADAQDDPQFALLFPGSEKADGWIKTSPVVGGDFQKKVGEYLPKLAPALLPFSGETIATAKYERMHEDKTESVTVCLVRATGAEDAYGMMSVSAPSADQYKQGEIRRRPDPRDLYVAKGTCFCVFTGATTGDDTAHLAEGLDLLAGKVLFELSDHAEMPRVIQYLQAEQLPPGRTLFVRDLESLKGPAGAEILATTGLADVAKMNKLLRLGAKVDFAVVVYTNKDWPTPDVIFLAEYPTREMALEVARQYRMILNKARASDKLDSNTLLKGPKGRFLMGTWTMETEAMTSPHLMNQIQSYLP